MILSSTICLKLPWVSNLRVFCIFTFIWCWKSFVEYGSFNFKTFLSLVWAALAVHVVYLCLFDCLYRHLLCYCSSFGLSFMPDPYHAFWRRVSRCFWLLQSRFCLGRWVEHCWPFRGLLAVFVYFYYVVTFSASFFIHDQRLIYCLCGGCLVYSHLVLHSFYSSGYLC